MLNKQKRKSPFTNIDWKKVAVIFQRAPIQRKEVGTYPSTKEILSFVAAAGAIGLVFVFPPAITGVAAFVRLGKRDYRRWGMRRTLNRLQRQKYVRVTERENGQTTVAITKQGMTKALTYQIDEMEIRKTKHWDKKWRVVIFDIPEKHKGLRDLFRMRLGQVGLYKLQESVYVSPYPCFDEIEFLRELYGIAFTVRYLLVERIEDDDFLRSHFGLSF